MRSKLAVLKNLIWAFGIVVCLAALLVGFGFAAFTKYDGSGVIEKPARGGGSIPTPTPAVLAGTGELKSLPETADGGQSYIDSLTFLCDSALIGIRDYGLLTGGMVTTQVWGSAAGNIPADSIADCVIRYPGDGSNISAANAAMIAKPPILVISLGMDSLTDVTEEDFTAAYTALLEAIHLSSPDTVIICCSLTGVTGNYSGNDKLTSSMVKNTNEWLRQVCADTGVYYADIASAVADSSGVLFSEYASSNGKALNSVGLNAVLDYLKTHTVP